MYNKKIGSFIAQRRKELGLTQLELATRLNITDRAVSKWENGRGLPDISLIKPLCDELNITVNDLLSGEKIQEDNLEAKAEENIINTLHFSKKKQNKYRKVIISIVIILLPIITVLSCFSIDLNRMRNNKPVVFSTWGFDYCPPINLSDEMLEITAENYLAKTLDKIHNDEKYFIAMKVYKIEEKRINEFETQYILYSWVRAESRRMLDDGTLDKINSFSEAYKFVIRKIPNDINNGYEVLEAEYPKGFSDEYIGNMKNIFPKDVYKGMEKVHTDGTINRLTLEINEQIKQYYDLNT